VAFEVIARTGLLPAQEYGQSAKKRAFTTYFRRIFAPIGGAERKHRTFVELWCLILHGGDHCYPVVSRFHGASGVKDGISADVSFSINVDQRRDFR
jgi:hypothetical protein